jgi:hypothetical protein
LPPARRARVRRPPERRRLRRIDQASPRETQRSTDRAGRGVRSTRRTSASTGLAPTAVPPTIAPSDAFTGGTPAARARAFSANEPARSHNVRPAQ